MGQKKSHLDRVQLAIDHIETHLREPLDVHEIAYGVDYSASHFQRLFQAIVGDTVADYIRRRRLTQALLDLIESERRILDIALDYQFESQESFTRAFKACFGITPGECRKRDCRSLAVVGKHRITTEYIGHFVTGGSMTPKIVDIPKFSIVGIEAKFISILSPDKTNDIVIPQLCAEYVSRRREIKNRLGREEMGLIYCLEDEPKSHPNECLYICAAKVPSIDEIPAGMIGREVPGGKYAVFEHRGTPDKFEHLMKFIYGSWFPKSGYEFDDRPELEFYDRGFEEESQSLGWDIYIPIK